MPDIKLAQLKPSAAKNAKPFLEEILTAYSENVHSITITGTAITDDFDEKVSDVNSIVVLKRMDLGFLELLAPLGKKYGKQKMAAPLIMTPDYIDTSLDVFPIEFLNIKLIHATVFGDDILQDIDIDRMDLRQQCEREMKTKLIWLRQSYLSAQGDRKLLNEAFVNSVTGYIPLFRGIISVLHKVPPIKQMEVLEALTAETNVDTRVFAEVLKKKYEGIKHSIDELKTLFGDYYAATEKLGKIVDEIKK